MSYRSMRLRNNITHEKQRTGDVLERELTLQQLLYKPETERVALPGRGLNFIGLRLWVI